MLLMHIKHVTRISLHRDRKIYQVYQHIIYRAYQVYVILRRLSVYLHVYTEHYISGEKETYRYYHISVYRYIIYRDKYIVGEHIAYHIARCRHVRATGNRPEQSRSYICAEQVQKPLLKQWLPLHHHVNWRLSRGSIIVISYRSICIIVFPSISSIS
jgi:hypothetical protein